MTFRHLKQQLSNVLNAKERNDVDNKVNCIGITMIQALELLEELYDGRSGDDENMRAGGADRIPADGD